MALIEAAMPGHDFATTRWNLVRQAAQADNAAGRTSRDDEAIETSSRLP